MSEDRVRKTIADMVVIMDGKPVKGALARPAAATKMSAHELAKKKTEDALRSGLRVRLVKLLPCVIRSGGSRPLRHWPFSVPAPPKRRDRSILYSI